MQTVYLDNSSTTAVLPSSAQAVMRCMTGIYGNPSSLHDAGIAAAEILERSRRTLAGALGALPGEVFFTSGGTESNNTAIFGAARKNRRRGNRIVISAIEHDCVLNPAKQLEQEGFEVVLVPPDSGGRVTAQALEGAVTHDTVLVSLMLVNNETGAIQDVAAASRIIREKGAPALMHCDAVQGFGKLPVCPKRLGCDLMTVSAHKLHGPKGVGALYIRSGVQLPPRNLGGGQEHGMRSGTEPVELIAGFADAVENIPPFEETLRKVAALNTALRNQLAEIDSAVVNSPVDGLPYVLNFSLRGIRSEVLLRALAADGIYISAGSACSRGHRSHVLTAQGLDTALIDSAVRVSFSRFSTPEEIDALISALKKADSTLKRGRR